MMKLKVDELDQYWSQIYFKIYIYNVYTCTLIDTISYYEIYYYGLSTIYTGHLCNEQGIFIVTATSGMPNKVVAWYIILPPDVLQEIYD